MLAHFFTGGSSRKGNGQLHRHGDCIGDSKDQHFLRSLMDMGCLLGTKLGKKREPYVHY